MSQCLDCPYVTTTTNRSECCADQVMKNLTKVEEDLFRVTQQMKTRLLPIPGERGQITYKTFQNMNRKERRAFLSNQKRK